MKLSHSTGSDEKCIQAWKIEKVLSFDKPTSYLSPAWKINHCILFFVIQSLNNPSINLSKSMESNAVSAFFIYRVSRVIKQISLRKNYQRPFFQLGLAWRQAFDWLMSKPRAKKAMIAVAPMLFICSLPRAFSSKLSIIHSWFGINLRFTWRTNY